MIDLTNNHVVEEENQVMYGEVPADRFLEAVRALWNRRRLLGRSVVAAAIVAALISILIPNRYTSTVELMPPETQSSGSLALLSTLAASTGAAGFAAADLLGMKSSGALFIGVLHSRTVEDRLIDRFDLRRRYGVRTMQDAREKLEEHTSTAEDRKSGIISISVTDSDRQHARDMAAAYVEELDRCVAELSTSAARRERIFLEQRLNAVNHDLDTAQKAFSEFASKNSTLDIKEQGKTMVEAAARLQGEMIAAQSELRGLQQIYADDNVRVRSLRARISELQQQLEKLGGTDDATQPTAATASAAAAGTQLYPSIRKLPLLGVTYADLYRQVRVQEAVYETLTKQYELAKVQEAKEIPTVRVLDAANWPEKRSFPPRILIVSSASTFVFLLVAIAILLGDYWSHIEAGNPRRQLVAEIAASVRDTANRIPGTAKISSAAKKTMNNVRGRAAAKSAGTGE